MQICVIGGGFYGCCLALFLRKSGARVTLVEKGGDLLTRASYANQARVHNGYHYPRSLLTGIRSAVNFPRFILDFRECVADRFKKIYAIARQNSKVSAYQFEKFCQRIDAAYHPAPPAIQRLFVSDLIEAVYVVTEYAFDALRLRALMGRRLAEAGVDIRLHTEVLRIDGHRVETSEGDAIAAETVFNCTYSQLNQVLVHSGAQPLALKHEIAELALVQPPKELDGLGITVMDGAFFSTMPFPAEDLYSLSHVRYTPHESWMEPAEMRDPHAYLQSTPRLPRAPMMIRDAQRYMPCMGACTYVRSLFEVKTVLVQNENDDGRPILVREHADVPGLVSILGGKIDNIYDVLDAMNSLHALTGALSAPARGAV